MHVRKRRSTVVVVLMLVFGALALSASSLGGTENTRLGDAHAGKVAGGFGEIYKANPKTLAKTLFSAKLLPANAMAKNISLAAYRRADMKVNQNLALQCWKNNVCSTGTGGKLAVAYAEGFREHVYRQVSNMEFALQAVPQPQTDQSTSASAHSD